ncbi:peptidoglycan editing factor PgeF [Parageobacillus thermoglucosidasius]|uniref:peptidoglycan editing factor PgeF n=1 Tax=Parageobacillus thermoglucosidasius TaxID=1426 RepID=UPI000B56F0B7|nr:peptidoglycan editing factor PgeF [Parageobacillus thermoglucosidasius]MBY6267802.1 peptidoglycan editing factor PgeF [Parageobacillus thermoglucosidasius]MED4904456.1 peptidoglycan editing factor PgeF [Parageobacillus thermoglucosidasius]MED4912284.1 peptidoglycan editing factor PgeF [Parageobacillus thermoglucosidasius]MED4943396.1 peptidoglycan editing factor PgeF [Parageobacillus thermoglucosidasius]MED4983292.1 peptidoglycan editing factor PgeF [Parageobacillus thermoglucosidasius]
MLDIFQQAGEEMLLLHGRCSFPNLVAGFTTKHGGVSKGAFATFNLGLHVGDEVSSVCRNRQRLADLLQFPLEQWVCCEQIHDARIEKVTSSQSGKGAADYKSAIAGTDGLYTKEAGLLLALCFADCVPLYFMAPKHGMIGLAHAGWRGTVKNIAGEMIHLWHEREHIPLDDIYVAIGPAIGACCYIVDDRVITYVDCILDGEQAPYKQVSIGQYALDLKELNKVLLIQAGVREEHIDISGYCTSCADYLFFSHRRDQGKTGRMMAFIGRKGE